MDRHRLDGPSWVFRSMTLRVWKSGTENRLSVNCDGPAGRAVTSTTNRRESRCKTLQLLRNWCKKTSFWPSWRRCRTDRHRCDGPSQATWVRGSCGDLCDGPSQARRPVTGCANPRQFRISPHVLRVVLDYSFLNYKDWGFILISLITWGLKGVTLS